MRNQNRPSHISRRAFLGLGSSSLAALCMPNPQSLFYLAEPSQYLLYNPKPMAVEKALLRLQPEKAWPAGPFKIMSGKQEIPYQLTTNGELWICHSFEPRSILACELKQGQPQKHEGTVHVQLKDDKYILQNEFLACSIPAAQTNALTGPVCSFRLADGRWVGQSNWQIRHELVSFTATLLSDGPLLAKLKLYYLFKDADGQGKNSFSEICISLGTGWKQLAIEERHSMGAEDAWIFHMSEGWQPNKGKSSPFGTGPGGDSGIVAPPPNRPLLPVEEHSFSPGLFIQLGPRWNQHFKNGWAFTAYDAHASLTAVAVKASRWQWPVDNRIDCIVNESGQYAGLRCPVFRGKRMWWLSPFEDTASFNYLSQYAWDDLDKINNELFPAWPGQATQYFFFQPYNEEEVNPTHRIRQEGKLALSQAGMPPEPDTFFRFQQLIHPDSFGTYEQFFSPENPNFFTDFNRVPIALASRLKAHPAFNQFRKQAAERFKEDLLHSITMPGGAGQECPGYSYYALSLYREIARAGYEHLSFDAGFIEPRLTAAERFHRRLSYPDGSIRRASPVGDSHPDREKNSGMQQVKVDTAELNSYVSEELPGFGIVFTHHPGKQNETYLSFKSGPNRCHYHGDQLSFHYCANGRPLLVDHHCSYHPRAGQEHMHNRLAFFTDDMPYANMDGYERILAFKSNDYADIAVAEVESSRLRQQRKFPPEEWDARYPQKVFDKPLRYRRTIMLVKDPVRDFIVIRDQYQCSQSVGAAYCLHSYCQQALQHGSRIDMGKLQLLCSSSNFTFKRFDWEHHNGGHERTLGIRLEIQGREWDFVTILYPGEKLPSYQLNNGNIRLDDYSISWKAGMDEIADTISLVELKHKNKICQQLLAAELDDERSQGEIGLFVPDAGYPFGPLPDWLIRQRTGLSFT